MAFCINCGQELTEDAKFCSNCGKAVCGETTAAQRKNVYEGRLHKCPNCGAELSSFIANCPACGYEIRDTQGSSSIRQLAMKLEQIESKRMPQKTGAAVVKALAGGQLTYIDEQKINLIKNFSIPNTKEDVREFLILASSNIDVKLYGMTYSSSQLTGVLAASQKAVSDAWLAKYEQAYQKAQLLFEGTQELANIQSLYNLKMKEIKRMKRQMPLLTAGIVGFALLLVVFIWLLVFWTGAI